MEKRVAIIGASLIGLCALGVGAYKGWEYHLHHSPSAHHRSALTVNKPSSPGSKPQFPPWYSDTIPDHAVIQGKQFIFIQIPEFIQEGHDDPLAVERAEREFLHANKGVKIDSITLGWDGVYFVWECKKRCDQ